MQFNEPTFLFLFLPVVLAIYYAAPARWPNARNLILLAATIFFAAWGGKQTVFILTGAVACNGIAAVFVARCRTVATGRWVLGLAIAANLLLLGWCKYAGFVSANLSAALTPLGLHAVQLPKLPSPPGISFVTFVAIAYLVDVFRGQAQPLKNPLHAALFFVFFSRLLAGPIVRYRDIGDQLARRETRREVFAYGVRRFIVGLGKKILIATTVAGAADRIFALPAPNLPASLAWLGIVSYTIQLYFDFSGYTDMAIGLGAMFGFRFPENFNYPYTATSIRDFWRRWHMTLSSWLRDYLYIPLGGSRCAPARIYMNLLVVFLLCGLWHGANWTFVFWGLFQGAFLVLERIGGERLLEKAPVAFRHGYALLVLMVSFVFFRADTLSYALGYLAAMSGLHHPVGITDGILAFVDPPVLIALLAGVVGSMPFVPVLKAWRDKGGSLGVVMDTAAMAALGVILIASAMFLSARTYTPFIYVKF